MPIPCNVSIPKTSVLVLCLCKLHNFCIDMCEGAAQESTPDVEINIATSDSSVRLDGNMLQCTSCQCVDEDTSHDLHWQHEQHAASEAPELAILPCTKMLQQVIDKRDSCIPSHYHYQP